jgi:hypothetical protein
MSNHISNTTAVSPESTEPPIPRLSIALMMLWTALSALGIVVSNWSYSRIFESDAEIDAATRIAINVSQVTGAITAASFAAALVGIGALLFAKTKGGRLLRHPGHWIIAVQCLTFISGLLMHPFHVYQQYLVNNYDWSLTGWQLKSYIFFGLSMLMTLVVPVALNALAARSHRGWWRTAFVLFAVAMVLSQLMPWILGSLLRIPFTSNIWLIAYQVSPIASGVAILIPLSQDVAGRIQRDWVHWVGATSVLLPCLLVAVQIVLYRLS